MSKLKQTIIAITRHADQTGDFCTGGVSEISENVTLLRLIEVKISQNLLGYTTSWPLDDGAIGFSLERRHPDPDIPILQEPRASTRSCGEAFAGCSTPTKRSSLALRAHLPRPWKGRIGLGVAHRHSATDHRGEC